MNYCHKYRRIILSVSFFAALCIASVVSAALIETPAGVVGYKDTAKQPWSGFHKHDPDRPIPPFVETGTGDLSVAAPADADDLSDLSAWLPNDWKMVDGAIGVKAQMLKSKKSYGDCQIHLEFWTPPAFKTSLESRGNSGVFIMGRYEVQIYDSHPSHKKQVYPDGQCAAIFGETPPLVNACRKEGQWQSYDIIFKAPVFKDGKLEKPASITMLHNGVLVHLNTVIHGPVAYR
ncbi:MAG: DUF1080 domain-containing protein, partial [Desulfobulbaceae bacterium]|nr:DUF1080 domain-containing protein [Desulfobulbaceae bacterium]